MIRVLVLWHMHQPFYKDLVTGQYRLPWVRMHALKDYYGMVKLLDEFPDVHQTFNVVPSLMNQIADYAAGTARDPFLDIASRPSAELSVADRRFALHYLFNAHPTHMIGRYPRYAALWDRYRGFGFDPERAVAFFNDQEFTDLQVLSQLAWFDEFFLDEPEIAALVRKASRFSPDDQDLVISRQRELIARVLPQYQSAAQRGLIELSTSPFFHPILPLLCDTDTGAASHPGLPLPQRHFAHPEDAREQLRRGLDLHEQVFGMRPRGVWPSEGSVSEHVVRIASELGVKWMASDEGVLGRSLNSFFERHNGDRLTPESADRLYTLYRFEAASAPVHMVFRDHALSDLIGFVYAGMPPQEAASDLIQRIKESSQTVGGRDVVVPIILDGENAWETYPQSGREFLRRFYDAISRNPDMEAATMSEAIERHRDVRPLTTLKPGSWINANFNVWIGAPEDNRSWDYLSDARDYFSAHAEAAPSDRRELAFEEILIAEGSDWNWWYGPEHHSANDRDFDELYRKHLSNVYQLFGGRPPEALAQPIARFDARPTFVPQTGYIHPRLAERTPHYFDWIGAAIYSADRTTSAMHGRKFYLESLQAGIDERSLYVRVDFCGGRPPGNEEFDAGFQLMVAVEAVNPKPDGQSEPPPLVSSRLSIDVVDRKLHGWTLSHGDHKSAGQQGNGHAPPSPGETAIWIRLGSSLEVQLQLSVLEAEWRGKLRLRVTMWRSRLPIDALPLEGSIDIDLLPEEELSATGY
jgi:alpha-amylase/alpha-mannosidase (GH57 family)